MCLQYLLREGVAGREREVKDLVPGERRTVCVSYEHVYPARVCKVDSDGVSDANLADLDGSDTVEVHGAPGWLVGAHVTSSPSTKVTV